MYIQYLSSSISLKVWKSHSVDYACTIFFKDPSEQSMRRRPFGSVCWWNNDMLSTGNWIGATTNKLFCRIVTLKSHGCEMTSHIFVKEPEGTSKKILKYVNCTYGRIFVTSQEKKLMIQVCTIFHTFKLIELERYNISILVQQYDSYVVTF